MRVIYDERRLTNPFFLFTGLAWGGMIAVSAIAFIQRRLWSSPELQFVPDVTAEAWVTGWEAAGLVGGFCLIIGMLLHAAATRIAADEHGIMELRCWAGDRFLLKWAEVRSWRVESSEEGSFDTDGQGGTVTRTRLVVELASAGKPLVVEQAWHTAVFVELNSVVPLLRSPDAEPEAGELGRSLP